LDDKDLHSKCGWTPFSGYAVQGRLRLVVLRGQTAVQDGEIQVKPGFGRVVEPVPADRVQA
jgi:dihydroorotase-like cyclic amidohydrolase